MSNPSGALRIVAGGYAESPAPSGWLLHERLVLDAFRRTAC
jgi:hypothetical protein